MSVRAMWQGVLQFPTHELPVRLYAAAREHTVHFRLLHKADREPVRQRMVNAETGEEVPSEAVRKGAEVEPGTYVLLDEQDLAGLEPEPSRTIEPVQFVSRGQVPHTWYDRPYFLGPQQGHETAYWALARALETSGQEGLAHWVMRKKEYVGALCTHEGCLALVSLRFADEVVSAEELEVPAGGDMPKAEVQMARQLVSMLAATFDPAGYRDEYTDRVRELVAAKAKGAKLPAAKRLKPSWRAPSIADALKASLEQARARKEVKHAA